MEETLAFDFDSELSTAIAHYEKRFGERDKRFHQLPVDFHGRPYAQTLVDDTNMTVAVKLDIAAKGNDMRLKYQIWHEAVHCLAPVRTIKTIWFEEGLAVESCMHAPPINRQYRKACAADLKRHPDWYRPWKAFLELKAEDEKIRAIHERAPERKFDRITPNLIVEIFRASPQMAETLCRRLGETRT